MTLKFRPEVSKGDREGGQEAGGSLIETLLKTAAETTCRASMSQEKKHLNMLATGIIKTIAPYFKPYVELHGLAGDSYYFRKESTSLREPDGSKRFWHPRLKHSMLRVFHSSAEGILYAALPREAKVTQLRESDLLYIGCSATGGARYWRGRPSPMGRYTEAKSCFHHEQMRRGRDGQNLEAYLARTGPVVVHTLTDADVHAIVVKHGIALPSGKYPAHQMERAVLAEGFRKWKWNARS